MATVDEIKLKISIDGIKKISAGIDKLDKKTQKFAKRFSSSFRSAARKARQSIFSLKSAIAGLIAVIAGGKLVSAFGGITSELDKLAKTSLRLNVPVEQLQKLEFFAQRSGVSFQGLTIGMQRLSRRVAEAETSGGPLAETLKSMGLSANSLAGLRPDQIFFKMGRAIKATSNENIQLLKTFKFFDTEGVASLQIFRSNIEELERDYKKFGITLSKADISGVEKFNDAVTNLRTKFVGFLRLIAARAAPALAKAISKINDMIAKGELQKLAGTIASKIVSMFSYVVKTIPKAINMFKSWVSTLKELINVLGGIKAGLKAIGDLGNSEPFLILKDIARKSSNRATNVAFSIRDFFKGDAGAEATKATEATISPSKFIEKQFEAEKLKRIAEEQRQAAMQQVAAAIMNRQSAQEVLSSTLDKNMQSTLNAFGAANDRLQEKQRESVDTFLGGTRSFAKSSNAIIKALQTRGQAEAGRIFSAGALPQARSEEFDKAVAKLIQKVDKGAVSFQDFEATIRRLNQIIASNQTRTGVTTSGMQSARNQIASLFREMFPKEITKNLTQRDKAQEVRVTVSASPEFETKVRQTTIRQIGSSFGDEAAQLGT